MSTASRRSPSLSLISSPSPARPISTSPTPSPTPTLPRSQSRSQHDPHPYRPSQSPFRYVTAFQQHQVIDEKFQFDCDGTPLASLSSSSRCPAAGGSSRYGHSAEKTGFHDDCPAADGPSCSSTRAGPHVPSPLSRQPSPVQRGRAPLLMASSPRASAGYPCALPIQPRVPRRNLLAARLRPWLPFIVYAMTTFGFILTITMWKVEMFEGLDELSLWLRADEYRGYVVIFLLIFLTTIPPFPLYSTFTILSGYTFGPWTGAVISYFAALSGALTVFIMARRYFRGSINRCLSHTVTMKRVVRAIEKRPKLLFLIRLAPYPYNVMNALLAGSPTLTLRTYTLCTALSLFKVIIHTSIGSSIHSFAEYHAVTPEETSGAAAEEDSSFLSQTYTIGGIGLCVAIAVYLSYVARKAVDEELEDEALENCEEAVAFLAPEGPDGYIVEQEMVERPRPGTSNSNYNSHQTAPGQVESGTGDRLGEGRAMGLY